MRRWFFILIATTTLSGCGTGRQQEAVNADLLMVDEYLDAQALLTEVQAPSNVKKLAAHLEQQRPSFEAALVRMFRGGDRRAAARLVFSQVIQVGTFVDADSELGAAAIGASEGRLPVSRIDGENLIFAGDLYFWWKEVGTARFPAYKPLDDWERSIRAQQNVIPMYKAHRQKRGSRPIRL